MATPTRLDFPFQLDAELLLDPRADFFAQRFDVGGAWRRPC